MTKKLRVLLVEDNDAVVKLYSSIIAGRGHVFLNVWNQEDARSIFQSIYVKGTEPLVDLVLMDNNLDDYVKGGGLELVRELRGYDQKVVIYMFSGDGIPEKRWKEVGASGSIRKNTKEGDVRLCELLMELSEAN